MKGLLGSPPAATTTPTTITAPARAALVAATLLLLTVACFLPAAIHRGVFFVHDIQYFFFPFHAAAARLMGQGELPLWNPYAFSGMPLLGDAQSGLLYPPNWLFFVLPADVALNQVILLHFPIAGAGMYALLRVLRLGQLSAFVGAVAFMFCGFMTARVVHLSILGGTALVPWVFLCVHRALASGRASLPWTAAAAATIALQIFTGHPQVPLYTACAVALYGLTLALAPTALRSVPPAASGDGGAALTLVARLRPLLHALVTLALGFALAAVQLLPLRELLGHSHRAGPGVSFEFIFQNSTSPGDWYLLLFPYAFGSLRQGLFSEEAIDAKVGSPLWEHSVYVGVLPLALAAVAIWSLLARRRRRGSPSMPPSASDLLPEQAPLPLIWPFLTGLLVLCAAVASGRFTPLSHVLYRLPILGQLRDPERAMVLGDFALAALAALGFELLRAGAVRTSMRRRLHVVAAGIVAVPIAALALLRLPSVAAAIRPQISENLQLARANALWPLILAAASAALIVWAARRVPGPRWRALAVALVIMDLGAYAAAFNPTADPALYRQPPEVMAAFKQDVDSGAPFRKASFLKSNSLEPDVAKETLAVSWAMVQGIEDINGFSSLQPRRYTDYLFAPEVEELSMGTLDDRRLLRADSPILSSLNVKYLLVPTILRPRVGQNWEQVHENEHVRVYRNRAVYPRAYFPAKVALSRDPAATLAAVKEPGFDGRELAYVEAPALPDPSLATAHDAPAAVTITSRSANRLQLTTETGSPRLLVLSEMYFPGWRAAIDGVPTAILRTNHLFRGLVVPAGKHQVMMLYRPDSAVRGLTISAVAAAILIALSVLPAVMGRWRRRRTPTPIPA